MNTSSVVLWLAEVPWGYRLAGRWTALLILAWGAHVALAMFVGRERVARVQLAGACTALAGVALVVGG